MSSELPKENITTKCQVYVVPPKQITCTLRSMPKIPPTTISPPYVPFSSSTVVALSLRPLVVMANLLGEVAHDGIATLALLAWWPLVNFGLLVVARAGGVDMGMGYAGAAACLSAEAQDLNVRASVFVTTHAAGGLCNVNLCKDFSVSARLEN